MTNQKTEKYNNARQELRRREADYEQLRHALRTINEEVLPEVAHLTAENARTYGLALPDLAGAAQRFQRAQAQYAEDSDQTLRAMSHKLDDASEAVSAARRQMEEQ